MNKSILLSSLKNVHDFIDVNIAALSGLNEVVSHITDTDTELAFYLACSFASYSLLAAA